MSVYGQWVDATISAGSSKSSAIDLGREYDYLLLMLPSMEACKLSLKVSETSGGTYYNLGKNITTNEENFDRADVWKLGGYRFIKIASDKGHQSDVSIRVKGMRA